MSLEKKVTALILKHNSPFTRLAHSPPTPSEKTGWRKREEGTYQTTVELHLVLWVVWFSQGFKTHQCKNMRWAGYSPMGHPCHCHQSNVPHITSYHCPIKDGLCMNMSGIPQTFTHCLSLYIIFSHGSFAVLRMAISVHQSVSLIQTLIYYLLDGQDIVYWSPEGEAQWPLAIRLSLPTPSQVFWIYASTVNCPFIDIGHLFQQPSDGFPWNLVQIFMPPSGWISITLVIPWPPVLEESAI